MTDHDPSTERSLRTAMHDLPPQDQPDVDVDALLARVSGAAHAGRRAFDRPEHAPRDRFARPALAIAAAVIAVAVGATAATHVLTRHQSPTAASAPSPSTTSVPATAPAASGSTGSAPAATCPAKEPFTTPKPTREGAADQLVPGQPDLALVCRYSGLDEGRPAGRLTSTHHLETAQARELAVALNSGPKPPAGILHCGNDTGGIDLVVFTFSDGPKLTVTVHLTGCGMASNGRVGLFTYNPAIHQLLN